MKNFTMLFLFIFVTVVISCGRNEPEIETNYTETSNISIDSTAANNKTPDIQTVEDTTEITNTDIDSDSGLAAAFQRQLPKSQVANKSNPNPLNTQTQKPVPVTTPAAKNAETVINSPLRNLLKNAQMGKSYSKKELIEQYKFPKEAVDLIKRVTCVGPNKLYFNWGSTWLVEKVSDAEFKNDTLIFAFKKNKTYVSGGAIGIKYNKKVYTELMLNNGSAYIPTVKGYHWEINK